VLERDAAGWRPVELATYENEDELQALLTDDRSLVPGANGSVVIREFPLAGGAVDLLCFDDGGAITLVECKLKVNRESRRAVVGQVFAYASALAAMDVDRFIQLVEQKVGSSLEEVVSPEAGVQVAGGDIRESLRTTLSSGAVRLVVAVDRITDELRGIIEYLNTNLGDHVGLVGLELGLFRRGDLDLLMVSSYGAELEDRSQSGATRRTTRSQRWSQADVEAAIKTLAEPRERLFLQQLLDHAEAHDAVFRGAQVYTRRVATITRSQENAALCGAFA
jgi:hypothetical protein